jgi:hypothetical protein
MPRCRLPIASAVVLAFTLAARADCIDEAAAHHQVNAFVLRAIGWHESRLDPSAVARNTDGSVDMGAFQINSTHLPDLARYGVTAASLADGCVSAYVAAWHYRRQVDRFGNTWLAVGAYHSRTAARSAWYANRIAAILMSWGAMPRAALPYAASGTLAPWSAGAGAPIASTVPRRASPSPVPSRSPSPSPVPTLPAQPPPSPSSLPPVIDGPASIEGPDAGSTVFDVLASTPSPR